MSEARNRPGQEYPAESKRVKIPVENLDLSEGWDTPAQAEIVFNALRKMGIDPEKCVYAGFDGNFIDLVLKTGTHSKKTGGQKMFCSDCKDLMKGYGHTDPNALDFAFDTQDPALAVYDSECLIFTGSSNFREYEIKPDVTTEQLVKAVFKLK